jgi:hypothetical protein
MATNMSARKSTVKAGVKQPLAGAEVSDKDEGGAIRAANASRLLCTKLLYQASGIVINTIGTMVKRVVLGNTDPFAFGPGSPARQGAGHE